MTAILGFLKLIPIKDWLYIGAIVSIVSGFLAFGAHERGVQAVKDAAQQAKITGLAKQHNLDAQALAANGITQIGDHYVATISTPVTDSPHVFVCKHPTASGSAVPETPAHPGVPDAAANVPAAAPVDIGPPVDTVGRDADARVVALQAIIQKLVDEMNGKTK